MNKPLKSDIESFVINRVREKREQASLSQSQLAEEIGVSNGFIGQVESPKYPAKYNLNHINKLAMVFKCSPKDFLPESAIVD